MKDDHFRAAVLLFLFAIALNTCGRQRVTVTVEQPKEPTPMTEQLRNLDKAAGFASEGE